VIDPRARLADGAHEILHRPLTRLEFTRLTKYLDLLLKWQKSQRLVGSTEPGWIVENLLLDSLLFLPVLPSRSARCSISGSGGGPSLAIPLKDRLNEVQLVLVESRRTSAVSFLASVIRELGLGMRASSADGSRTPWTSSRRVRRRGHALRRRPGGISLPDRLAASA